VAADDGPPIRVLLTRTSRAVSLPQPGRAYLAESGGRRAWIFGPLEVSAAAEREWQVGAWTDPATAAAVARRLGEALGPSVRVRQEPTPSGLTRVRARWAAGEPADPEAALAAVGFPGAMAVAAGGSVRVVGRDGAAVTGDEVLLVPDGDWPTAVGERHYRGRFRARLGGAELLLINDLGLEAYLRGVVPVEMGPYVFPELAALKAQAVAARTYAVAHLGDHDDEGWDICDTPACQAYHGVDAEHPLSDRAVAETRGLIATWGGEPIDAMYTSTCGGRTEDAGELFRDRAQPYLTGVACAWERPLVLVGQAGIGDVDDSSGLRRVLARQALGAAAAAVGPAELLPGVAALCGGDRAARPMRAGPDGWAEALLRASGLGPAGVLASGGGVDRLVGLADLFEVPLSLPPAGAWDRGWHLEAAAAVLEIQGVIVSDRGEAVPRPDGVGFYPRRGDGSETLPTPLPLLWRWEGHLAVATELRVQPGTTLERYRMDDRVLALVVVRSGGEGDADRRSAWRSWARDRSWEQLASGLGMPELERLEVTRRSRSGRVVGLLAVDRAGRSRSVEGFEVRRVLDLPETLFEMHERRLPDGSRAVRFLGRGWGHGVGLCQNGAYGLARAGMPFDAILRHYYTGVTVEPWNPD
jgi:stage II sporulation protein D